MNATETSADWKKVGRHVGLWTLGAVLGTVLAFLVLAIAGAIVRIPGVQPFLRRMLTADYDAPLMWLLLVSSWILGVIVTYVVATRTFGSRDAGPGS